MVSLGIPAVWASMYKSGRGIWSKNLEMSIAPPAIFIPKSSANSMLKPI